MGICFSVSWGSGGLPGFPKGCLKGLEGHPRGLEGHLRGLEGHLRGLECHLRFLESQLRGLDGSRGDGEMEKRRHVTMEIHDCPV